MRIHVIGQSPTAIVLRAHLDAAGYVVSEDHPTLTIDVDVRGEGDITVDTPDCRLGRLATHRIAELSPFGIVRVLVSGTNRNDRALRIVVPERNSLASLAVERGVVRAVDQWAAQEVTGARQASPATIAHRLDDVLAELLALRLDVERPWWQKVFG